MSRFSGPCLLIGLGVTLVCLGAGRPDGTSDPEHTGQQTPNLTVRGSAELHKPADQLRLRIGVVTEASQAQQALGQNSQRMDAVVRAVKKAGIAEGEYETGRFSLQPIYARRPRQAAPDWRPQIIAYQATNILAIKTKKLELAGELIQAANEAGANSIDSIGFDLADPRAHRAEAISRATAHALADARILADAANIKLVRIISIVLDGARPLPIATAARRGMAMAEAAVSPPIVAGEVSVHASVTVVYEIASP
ncbi:MAG: SIMPL domain-containing protein [Planctomycetes bacterium]|nr:SIMPL domain-containing protein [Planctomycetota bacterium]